MSTPSPAPQPVADAIEQRDPWRGAWQAVTGDALLATLCLIAGLALAAEVFLPQAPAGGTADPLAYNVWQTQAHAFTGAFYDAVDTLGLFNAMQVFWARAVSAIAAVIIALRLAVRLARLLAARHAGEWLRDEERVRVSDQAPALAALRACLLRAHYRVVSSAATTAPMAERGARSESGAKSESGASSEISEISAGSAGSEPGWLAVDRAPWADIASIALHLGLLAAVAGILLNGMLGWNVARQQVDSDASSQLAHSKLALQVAAVDIGQQTAVLQLQGENRQVALPLGQRVPLYWVRQAPVPCCMALQLGEMTPGYHISAINAAGNPLTITTSSYAEPTADVLLILRSGEPGRLVAVEASNLALLVSADKGGSVKVYSVPLGNVLTDTLIQPTLAISNTTLQFKPTMSVVLAAQYRPGDGLIWAGGILVLLGLIAVSVWPTQRIVVRHHGHWTEFYASGRGVRRVVRELAQRPPPDSAA